MYRLIIPLFALAFLLVSCTTSTPPSPINTNASSSPASTASGYTGEILKGLQRVVLHTSKGDVTLELNADVAPKTVTNFVMLSKEGYFNNLTFHRVIPGFMIQGGDPNGNGTGGRSIFGETFEDEINANSYGLDKKLLKDAAAGSELPKELENMTLKQFYESKGFVYNSSLRSLPMVRGVIAMANRGPNTNGSQFFIIQGDKTPWLEGQHTVFGTVVKGMDIVDKISTSPADPASNRPTTPITFTTEIVAK